MNISLTAKHHALAIQQANLIARILQEAPNTTFQRPQTGRLPGDPWAIRGIPAIGGRGSIGGHIAGTRPGS